MKFPSDGISFVPVVDPADKDEYWSHIRAKGYFIVVKPYVRPDSVDGLMVPDSMRFEDSHHSVAAQVIDVGPVAYTDEKICGGVSWAETGDWVFIPRVAGSRVALKKNGKDIVLRIVKEDDIIAIIKDPSEWEIRITQTKF